MKAYLVEISRIHTLYGSRVWGGVGGGGGGVSFKVAIQSSWKKKKHCWEFLVAALQGISGKARTDLVLRSKTVRL